MEVDSETAVAYWDHVRLLSSPDPADQEAGGELNWACDDVTDAMARGGDLSLVALTNLATSAETSGQIEHLGALLQDLIQHQGDQLLDALADLIAGTPRLRNALASVAWGSIPEPVAGRLRPLAAPQRTQ